MPAVRSDLWLPLTMDQVITGDRRILDRGTSWLNVLGRLAPGVTRVTAEQEMNALVQRLVQQYPNDHRGPNQVVLDPMWRSPFGGNVYFAALLPVLLGMAVLDCCSLVPMSPTSFWCAPSAAARRSPSASRSAARAAG